MKPHTEDTKDVESILHPSYLIENNTPQKTAIERELKTHINTFINRLTVKEIIAFSFTLTDKTSLQEVLQQHHSLTVRNLKFNHFTYIEWQNLLGSNFREFGTIGHKIQGEMRAYIWNLGYIDE